MQSMSNSEYTAKTAKNPLPHSKRKRSARQPQPSADNNICETAENRGLNCWNVVLIRRTIFGGRRRAISGNILKGIFSTRCHCHCLDLYSASPVSPSKCTRCASIRPTERTKLSLAGARQWLRWRSGWVQGPEDRDYHHHHIYFPK